MISQNSGTRSQAIQQKSYVSVGGEYSAMLKLDGLLNDFWLNFRREKAIKYIPNRLDDAYAIADISEPQLAEVEYYNIPCTFFPFNKLFIRKCYKDLLPRFLDPALEEGIITGSPGVGKTCFLLYLLKESFEHSENKKQLRILTSGLIPGVDFVLFDHESALILAKDEAFNFLVDPNLIYYADSLLHFSRERARTFLFSSLKEHEDFFRLSLRHFMIYMPTWSLDELITWNKVLQFKFEDGSSLHERYRLFGGKVRYVLEGPVRTAGLKREMITKLDSLGPQDFANFKNPFYTGRDYPFSLTSIIGLGPRYEKYVIKLASQWVIELVQERLLGLPDLLALSSSKDAYLFELLDNSSFFELNPETENALRNKVKKLKDSYFFNSLLVSSLGLED